jgi:hypothetical protein
MDQSSLIDHERQVRRSRAPNRLAQSQLRYASELWQRLAVPRFWV